ncbi:hypothetical protein ACF1BS_33730 [Streptomyces sp. NPDC014748]|uniref:hypothetical protein n=1 Tax=unclassified Streptomyces TaxID=2593676 RepID=UPI001F34D39F|nr:hypothetical protein [Streptomyces sp. GMY02]
MSRMSFPSRCVVHDASRTHRPSAPEVVIIVVITVLACGLSASGLEPSSIVAVLGGAGLVAAGTLLALRGAGQGPVRTMTRIVHAVTAP